MAQQSRSEGGTFGKRRELKFLVPEGEIRKYFIEEHAELSQKLLFDYIVRDSLFNLIDNIYFDNYELQSYHDTMEKKSVRHKLRLRNYSHNGIPEENIFFEIKSKRDKETFKVRLELRKSWLKSILKTGTFAEEEILALNKDKSMERIRETLDRISYLTQDLKYRPLLKTSYGRFAFRHRDYKRFRLTIDRDIRYTRLYFSEKPRIPYEIELKDTDAVIEVKYDNKEKPLEKILPMATKFGKPTRFSKYCFGMYNTKHRFMAEDLVRSLSAAESYRDGS